MTTHTDQKQKPEFKLTMNDAQVKDGKGIFLLTEKGVEIHIQITENSLQTRNLPLLIKNLVNEYYKLPLKLRFSPATMFQSMENTDNRNVRLMAEIDLIRAAEGLAIEQRNDARAWNKIYRWSLLAILIGLSAYSTLV